MEFRYFKIHDSHIPEGVIEFDFVFYIVKQKDYFQVEARMLINLNSYRTTRVTVGVCCVKIW